MAPQVVLVADHASDRFGGEAALVLNYFRRLTHAGVVTHLVTHERVQDELRESLDPSLFANIHFVSDTTTHRGLWSLQSRLPRRVGEPMFGIPHRLLSQFQARAVAEHLLQSGMVSVVHQPIPISPKEPSVLTHMSGPVVIGPLNGGVDFPAFAAHLESRAVRAFVPVARFAAHGFNQVLRGKLEADLVLVANERTRRALPFGCKDSVVDGLEISIDLDGFGFVKPRARSSGDLRLVFVARLLDFKGLHWALQALARTSSRNVTLTVCGDGPESARCQKLAAELGIAERVEFRGWQTHRQIVGALGASDALVHPCVVEAAGGACLEAMAVGRPVIALRWGGPGELITDASGIAVWPTSENDYVAQLAAAMDRLSQNVDAAVAMSYAARAIAEQYSWPARIVRTLRHYENATERYLQRRKTRNATRMA